ncbi:helix-turn-helix domain-containing protein [Flavobacterium psychrotrophum]|uniref:helix-turn-helix domain-containing protein n=1 Tax=Flavobacterium psychrotrophum TaxID=2294119 RepID=UPI000E30BB13|nr:helix-turn-helix transcriptional regulator [Flavobacterium psychrotrophum]
MKTVSLPHPNTLLAIEPLDYDNPYDFHTAHRHDYFEIILITHQGGYQFIDFSKYELKAAEVYVVYPGQIHLLERSGAQGMVIQFKKEVFDFIFPIKHYQLYIENPAILLSAGQFSHIYSLADNIRGLMQIENLSHLSIYKAYSYLQILLISLIEQDLGKNIAVENNFASHFISLLGQNIYTKRKVIEYAELLGCSTDRLTVFCKNSFGKTPLKLIHEELLLEIRRLMLLNQLSLKEIAFRLNFDSPANFSAFIKSATNKTPAELQAELIKNYK